MKTTARGEAPENDQSESVPTNRKLADGQFADHWVLSSDERAKGYVRPVRIEYTHVGLAGPTQPLRDLNEEEVERYGKYGYVKFEPNVEPGSSIVGRYWTQAQIDKIGKGCGVTTRMPQACAETYAREPSFYGSTFCCGCGTYFRVGADGEFVWKGTGERVGT